jgi:hypothetical protein
MSAFDFAVRVAWAAACLTASAARAQPHARHSRDAEASFEQVEPHSTHDALMTGPLGIPRSRDGSGTSWLPDDSPMYGWMAPLGHGGFMLHGNVFAGFDWFGSDRGAHRFVSTNQVMAMAFHPLGPGEIAARVMLSAEPLTVGERGYPLVLQTGETSGGEPLHDRQHPHGLFMELALLYTLELEDFALQFYAAPAGEPALGPTAYPHRPSAISDPLAPIGHHWQDSSHILFGVFTTGIFTRHAKVEVSWFNGREPDEERWDLDLRAPDSFSARIALSPHRSLSFQASYGWLDSPEAREPEVSVHRVTASATHDVRLGREANVATTIVYGQNDPSHGPLTPSFLVESNWNIDGHHVVFGRAEYVRKAGHDLALPEALEEALFDTGMLALGYAYYFGPFSFLAPGLGVRGTIGYADPDLEQFYGTRFPLGVMFYAQLRPAAMEM